MRLLTGENISRSACMISAVSDACSTVSSVFPILSGSVRPVSYTHLDVYKRQLINRAAKLEAEAFRVEIRRAVNYLQAKKPVFYDRSGLYDIQIAKLYLACDERDKARELIYDVITSYSVMDDRSPLKDVYKRQQQK